MPNKRSCLFQRGKWECNLSLFRVSIGGLSPLCSVGSLMLKNPSKALFFSGLQALASFLLGYWLEIDGLQWLRLVAFHLPGPPSLPKRHPALFPTTGCGSKLKHQGTAGFGTCCHLPGQPILGTYF